MTTLTNQNLALEKTCRVNLHFNTSICDAITLRNNSGYERSQEAEVQAIVQKWEAYRSFIIGSVPVVLVVLFGAWSDRHKRRKPLIMLPLLGATLSNVLLLLCSIYFMELKMQYSWLADIIPNLFSGGFGLFILGIFSYVGGIGDAENKTTRIGLITITQTVAISIGTFLSGIVLHSMGFIGVYAAIATVTFVTSLYCLFVVKEQDILSPEEKNKEESFKEIISMKHIKSLFETCFRNDEGKRRQKMFFLMTLLTLTIGPTMGEMPIVYMSVRLRFGWNEVNFSFFSSFQFIVQLIGNTFTLVVLLKYLKLRDVTLGIIAMCSKITAVLIYAFAPTGFYFHVAAVTEIFFGANLIALRAMMAKIVEPHELGQSNSVFGICEGLTPVVFGPLYSMLYIRTLMFFPGAFYLMSGCISIIVMSLYIWLYKLIKKEEKRQPKDNEQIETEEELLEKTFPAEMKT
ncbi:hypothetical protein WA026_013452 [Henosepilachna vigintioctopunctata]